MSEWVAKIHAKREKKLNLNVRNVVLKTHKR